MLVDYSHISKRGIEFPKGLTSFGKTTLERPENMQELVRLVSLEYGKEMQIRLLDNVEKSKPQANSVDDLIKSLDVPFNIIEG